MRSTRSVPAFGILVTLWFVVLTAVPARANVGPKLSDAELVAGSEVILTGRVARVVAGWDDTLSIYTYVVLDVGQVLKGWVPERQIVLKQLGGAVDDLELVVADQASFTSGEEVLVFLEVRPRDDTVYTAALWQGKWTIRAVSGTAERQAVRYDPGVEGRGGAPTDVRALGPFLQQVWTLSGDDSRRPSGRLINVYPMETPPETGPDRGQYILKSNGRWHQPDSGGAISLDLQSGGQPGLAGGGLGQISNAMAQWNGAGSAFRLSLGSTRGPRCGTTFEGDRRTLITFMDPCGEISNAGRTLAIASFYINSTERRAVNGINFRGITQAYVINNDSAEALRLLTNSGCFYEIQLHELGHTFGLDHSTDTTARMYAYIRFEDCSGGGRPLGADDVAGVRFIYPASPPGPPESHSVSVSGNAVVLRWGTPGLGGGAVSYVLQGGSSPGGSNIFNRDIGNVFSVSAPLVPDGLYFTRVLARNVFGTSGPSNEVRFRVGSGCDIAPGPPTGLTVSKSGTLVTLRWTAPTTGDPATSYVLEAGTAPGASNVGVMDVGNVTSLTVNAPNGTFFVRVKGVNACGTGSASNEVTVTIP